MKDFFRRLEELEKKREETYRNIEKDWKDKMEELLTVSKETSKETSQEEPKEVKLTEKEVIKYAKLKERIVAKLKSTKTPELYYFNLSTGRPNLCRDSKLKYYRKEGFNVCVRREEEDLRVLKALGIDPEDRAGDYPDITLNSLSSDESE